MRYEQYKTMQDIREIELEIVDQTQTPFQGSSHYSTSPPSHRRIFHYVHTGPSTKGPPLRNYKSTLGVHYSSLKHSNLHTRGIGTKPKHDHLYTRGIGTKPKHNHLYTRGIRHKAKAQTQSPLHKRDTHKAKSKKRLQSW